MSTLTRLISGTAAIALAGLFGPLSSSCYGQEKSDFEYLHALISPQQGESRWMEIDWYPNVWEGRMQAAKEGKPIFFMAGSGGAPCAGC